MACTARAPCGGLLQPDVTFNRQAEAEGVDVRRYTCLMSHSFIVGPPPKERGHVVGRATLCNRSATALVPGTSAKFHPGCTFPVFRARERERIAQTRR